jgi:hypothetical protein
MKMRGLVIALVTAANSLFAQDSSRISHIISAQFGINQVKDENLHGKVSTGTIAEFGYGGELWKDNWQQYYLTFGYSRPKTQFEDVSKSANLRLDLGYAYTLKVVHRSTFRYYLGPDIGLAYSACFYPNWDDSHLYWADYLSLGLRNNFRVDLKKEKQWVTSISLPLFSVYSRPEHSRLYKIDDTTVGGIAQNLNSNITPAHLTNTFYIKLNTEVRFRVFQNKRQAFGYRFSYLRVKENDASPFKQIIHEFGISLFL